MEAAVHPTAEQHIDEVEEASQPAAKTDARKMFRYSEYVHVGEGAQDCPTARAIAAAEQDVPVPVCTSPEHFHAWCRLPNPYQHEDIRKKALAAKARKIRELKDPESDASVVLDSQLDNLRDEMFTEQVLDELLAVDFAEDYTQATQDVEEREEFEHMDQDREEYNRLKVVEELLSGSEQSDEFKRLLAHMNAYIVALRERMAEIQEPKREELRARDIDTLVSLARDRRVEQDADREFIETYNAWQWFVGTLKPQKHETLGRPHIAMWDDIGTRSRPAAGTMYGEAPEVIETLKVTFNELQVALQRGSAGN